MRIILPFLDFAPILSLDGHVTKVLVSSITWNSEEMRSRLVGSSGFMFVGDLFGRSSIDNFVGISCDNYTLLIKFAHYHQHGHGRRSAIGASSRSSLWLGCSIAFFAREPRWGTAGPRKYYGVASRRELRYVYRALLSLVQSHRERLHPRHRKRR